VNSWTTASKALFFRLMPFRSRSRSARFDAMHDSLTGLPNRQLFAARLDETLRLGNAGALVFVDLDRFTAVNDTLGHLEGDNVLIEVARLLRAGVRSTDTVGRLADDEFVVVIQSDNEAEVLQVAERLVDTLRVTRMAGADRIVVTASVGMVQWPADTPPDRAEQLMRAADNAMSEAKHLSGNQLVVARA
jgi:diguanylate cyclase (GGDEF)-like protein